MTSRHENAIQNRYDFVILYDVENGNPNGDPDAGNMPRIDPETGHGIVTDVCIKRKIRNYIELVKGGEKGYDIYVKQGTTLNAQDQKGVKAAKGQQDKSSSFLEYMCCNFYDIRTFGAVMTTAAKDPELSNSAGQVRGPVQLTFARSIDQIVPQEITITRVAITTEAKGASASTEMGRKHVVPYALYRQEGFISANLAQKVTGFSEGDLELLWQAIIHMFDDDRSAARGKMTFRKLVIFRHDGALGSAAAQGLFDLVDIRRHDGVEIPRRYDDYEVVINTAELPDGVTCEDKE